MVAPILKHGPDLHQGQRLWLFAGTCDGPPLAKALLAQGWCVRVSLVSPQAARAYSSLLEGVGPERLELHIGAISGAEMLVAQLALARAQARPFAALIDATHPFARVVSQTLAAGCQQAGLPLLRLQRPSLPLGEATVLPELSALGHCDLVGERLLLALGARQLAVAVASSAGALHHARLLPSAHALQQALGLGLAPERIACLQPSDDFAVEAALVRQWGITAIVCRQSGGRTETGWRQVAARQGCRLLLLARPAEPGNSLAVLSPQALLAKLETLLPDAGVIQH